MAQNKITRAQRELSAALDSGDRTRIRQARAAGNRAWDEASDADRLEATNGRSSADRPRAKRQGRWF